MGSREERHRLNHDLVPLAALISRELRNEKMEKPNNGNCLTTVTNVTMLEVNPTNFTVHFQTIYMLKKQKRREASWDRLWEQLIKYPLIAGCSFVYSWTVGFTLLLQRIDFVVQIYQVLGI
ncbi:hypothetical protein K7X08_030748 [Anisodus acutangulus]|uniref:Uncharacterized protein n=1 Tax=Anisodus acutangulus TaxID=402998 RepID=A0A9Q1M3K5_9SOLA|nr:hypothetical protein K7X08_030748 [Anisodus acutangulus]